MTLLVFTLMMVLNFSCYSLCPSPMHLSRGVEYWVESAAICRKKGLMDTLGLSNCSADEVRTAVYAGEKVSWIEAKYFFLSYLSGIAH